ncbi:MAG: hypothetical protein LBS43_09730 [Prevotellaceae bacterium]|nr:hypothetical protein [Prevotellaceae bacterium]
MKNNFKIIKYEDFRFKDPSSSSYHHRRDAKFCVSTRPAQGIGFSQQRQKSHRDDMSVETSNHNNDKIP